MMPIEQLRIALKTLASEVSDIQGGWRRLGPNDRDGAQAALAAALSEVVIPCHLTLRNIGGERVMITAGNRRIHRLGGQESGALAPFADLFDHDLEDTDAAVYERVADMFRAFTAAGGSIEIKSELRLNDPPQTRAGLSVDVLGAMLEPGQGGAGGGDPTEAAAEFLARVTDSAESWILFDQRHVKAHSGNGPDEALLGMVEALNEGDARISGSVTPQLLVVADRNCAPTPLVAAWYEDWVFAAHQTSLRPEELEQAWRRLGL